MLIVMPRILILIVLGWILYQIIKRVIANAKARNPTDEQDTKVHEKMLQCTRCGCHVPESDTKLVNEKILCNNPECSKPKSDTAESDKSSHGN
jgi:formylmethanofuran dehydrogenase subunit E